MWQRFSDDARRVIFSAQEAAQRFQSGYVSTEHLLVGLCRDEHTVAVLVLHDFGHTPEEIVSLVEKHIAKEDRPPAEAMTLTPRAKRCIDLAYSEARELNDSFIGPEHMLLGLIREGDANAGKMLEKIGLTLEEARKKVIEIRSSLGNPVGTASSSTFPQVAKMEDSLSRLLGRSGECRIEVVALALLREGVVLQMLHSVGVDVSQLSSALEQRISKTALEPPEVMNLKSTFAEPVTEMFKMALFEAEFSKGPLGSEHFFIAIFRLEKSALNEYLTKHGVELSTLRASIWRGEKD